MEEATIIATEYISTLDNLPAEVQHLLAEIRLKEDRSQELQAEIQSKTQRYIRHAIKGNVSPKDVPTRVDEQFAEIDKLAAQKIALAQRIVDIIGRACGRLDVDIERALAASGEPPIDLTASAIGAVSGAPTGSTTSLSNIPTSSWTQARTNADKLKETLKNEISIGNLEIGLGSPAAAPPITSGGTFKKRRLNPPTAASTPTPSGGSHPSRSGRVTLSVTRSSRRSESVLEADGEGDDDDSKDVGDTEDQELYCYCRKLSYGEMVGCDNSECPYQWFHLACTGIKGPLPDSWYCSDCAPKFQFGGPSEKARKGRRPRT